MISKLSKIQQYQNEGPAILIKENSLQIEEQHPSLI